MGSMKSMENNTVVKENKIMEAMKDAVHENKAS